MAVYRLVVNAGNVVDLIDYVDVLFGIQSEVRHVFIVFKNHASAGSEIEGKIRFSLYAHTEFVFNVDLGVTIEIFVTVFLDNGVQVIERPFAFTYYVVKVFKVIRNVPAFALVEISPVM